MRHRNAEARRLTGWFCAINRSTFLKTKSGRKRPLIDTNLLLAVHEEQQKNASVSHAPLEKEASQKQQA